MRTSSCSRKVGCVAASLHPKQLIFPVLYIVARHYFTRDAQLQTAFPRIETTEIVSSTTTCRSVLREWVGDVKTLVKVERLVGTCIVCQRRCSVPTLPTEV